MNDMRKTKVELIAELQSLRAELAARRSVPQAPAGPDRALLCSLVERMLEPTVILGWDGAVLFGNALCAQVLGVTDPDDLIGKNIAEFLHPDAVTQAAGDLQKVKDSEAPFFGHYELLVDGRTVPVESHGTKIDLSDGSVDLVSFRDVSEKKRAEVELKALEKSERIFRALTESLQAMVMIVNTGQGRIVYANDAAVRGTGYSLEELTAPVPPRFLTEKSLKEAEVHRAAYLRGEHVPTTVESTIVTKSGEERVLQSSWALVEMGDEGLVKVTTSFDITERKQMERALQDSERKFRELAEFADAQITVIQDDRYVYANQTFLDYYGLNAADLPAHDPQELAVSIMSKEQIAAIVPVWQAAAARGDNRFRVEFQDLEGRWFQSNVTITELEGKESFLCMTFDVTDLKRAQNEMYRADKMAALGQIIAGVAHEINNPNNFIYFNLPILKKYIEAIRPMLEHHLEDDPDLRILNMPYAMFLEDIYKLLDNMEHGSKRITGIVSELKTYVRSDEDAKTRTEPIGPVVERVMALVGKQVRKMVKRFEVTVADDLPLLRMNSGKIEQVLINLVINAGQAANKDDSWVRLTVEPETLDGKGGVVVVVADNGTGIPEKIRDRIFEPFFTSKGREAGTGLGLSICHRIVEEHGGAIDVSSTPGEGTTFTIHLPAGVDRS